MNFGGAMLALSAAKAITSVGQGYAQSAEDKYNASLATNEAQLYQVQGNITQGQYTREAGKLLSTQTAQAGAAGIQPTGSLAAVMLDSQTQINTDAAIARFNTQMNINYAQNTAAQLRRKASQDVFSGYSSAFSDTLQGAYGAYSYNKKTFDLSSGANKV